MEPIRTTGSARRITSSVHPSETLTGRAERSEIVSSRKERERPVYPVRSVGNCVDGKKNDRGNLPELLV